MKKENSGIWRLDSIELNDLFYIQATNTNEKIC